jgi:hypothetical protein
MKKRLSFSANFGFGTLTKGIWLFPIADFRLPIQEPPCCIPHFDLDLTHRFNWQSAIVNRQ